MTEEIVKKLQKQSNQIVTIDLDNSKIKYSDKITKPKIEKLRVNENKTSEEIIRAYLVDKLVNELGYNEESIELEKFYTRDSIGREKQKNRDDSARIDIIVKDKNNNPFLYIELKAPEEFEKGESDIKGQLFELSDLEEKQHKTKVKYLMYYSLDISDELSDRLYLIEKDDFEDYDDWAEKKDTTYGLEIPYNYGKAKLKERIKDENDSNLLSIGELKMSEIRRNIHNVLWSSGVEDNVAYIFLVKFLLTKIYDEDETEEDDKYQCQIFDKDYENEANFFERINNTYKEALRLKLNYTDEDLENVGAILNTEDISIQSLYFLVKELQNYSFSKSIRTQKKDILGHFFEETNREKFKQSKGQFFTTTNVVDFLIYAMSVDKLAIDKFEKDYTLPYIIDPSTGSGTFLIEAMKIITKEFSKHNFKLNNTKKSKLKKLFPSDKPNDWAEEYIYGIDNSYSLTVSTKVNMILHGDGSSSTFKDDGLANFQKYTKYTNKKLAVFNTKSKIYKKSKGHMAVNEQFDVIISNPPFSVSINETKEEVNKYFLFGDKKNSENLFLERYYQLLNEGGRLGVVLPESVFDTTENKYIRLFLFKYFKIKAVVSLPQITFEPFTSTKTSILIAQKKTTKEVELWNDLWLKYGNEWSLLKTRVKDYILYFVEEKKLNKRWAKDVVEDIEKKNYKNIKKNIYYFLKDYISAEDKKLKINELLIKYTDEIKELSKMEKDTEVFGFYNAWWVFGEVAKEINIDYDIFMAEASNVGYKRTKRGENVMPNDLFDLEYAPNKLSLENIKSHYNNLIDLTTANILNLKNEKKEVKIKWIAKKRSFKKEDEKTKKANIKKQLTNLENTYKLKLEKLAQSNEKLEELKIEYKNALEIYQLYYENDKLKDEYYDRVDNELVKFFKSGIMEKWASSDIVLRKKEEIKILDSLRMSVKWD